MNELFSRCSAWMPEYMKLWETMVNIDSGSGHAEGLRRMAATLEPRLEAAGFTIERHPGRKGDDDSEYSIVARKTGKGTASLLLMAHMDTVFPPGTAAERPFTVDGDWAWGPGVSDCKSGVGVIVAGMDILKDFDGYGKLTVLFNCDEEIGSPSSKQLIMDLAREHDAALSYEPGGVGDTVTTSRKGNGRLVVKTFGKASHAGSAPEEGRNAFMELIYQVDRLATLGNKEKKTTVEFTVGKSGDRVNVVPEYAEATADVRVTFQEELDRLDADIAALTREKRIPDCRVEAALVRSRPPFSPNAKTDELAALAADIYREIDKELPGKGVGGASDANYAALAGCPALCSLGPAKGGPNHSPGEKAHIPTVVPRIYLLARLVQRLSER